MTPLSALWLPLLLSVVIVFVASSIIHMAPLWHRGDYPAPPNQDAIMAALHPFDLPQGDYLMPRAANTAEMRSPEFQEKLRRGPVMLMTVMATGPWRMGGTLVQWTIYVAVVAVFAAYIASRALAPNVEYSEVFRFVGTVTFAGHALGVWPITIWYKRGVGLAVKNTFDALIYALLTAGVFGWLWP